MAKNASYTFVGRILEKIAPTLGATVILEPQWKVVGQIVFKNGCKRYFRSSSLDINPMGAAAIANDKDHASFFMQNMGYPAIPGKTFFSTSWAATIGSTRDIDEAWKYAQKTGLPLIVKPNNGTHGEGVARVQTKAEFYRAVKYIFTKDTVVLVQKIVTGKDYRVVVFDDQVIAAYERIPLGITGNGRSTIKQLLSQELTKLQRNQRDTRLTVTDPRIQMKLKREGMSLESVPAPRARVSLLDNANLSAGGSAIDVTAILHSEFAKQAIQLTKDMGLRLCGVDLLVEGDISEKPTIYSILEINASPGLSHYATLGTKQQKVVEDLYTTILKSLAI